MSVSLRDVLFSVEGRAQASIWSTGFVAPVYYWAAGHLDPSFSLFSARRWKAVAMALLAPLVFLVLRRRLRSGRAAALLGGATVVLLPSVAMFGWLATDNGLESVIGAAGLYLATSRRRVWTAAPVLAGLAVTTYPSGVAWAAVIVAVCVWRGARPPRHDVPALLAAAVAGAATVAIPRLWWTAGPQRMLAGGGTIDGSPAGNLATLLHQLAISGRSYYYFADTPALGSAWLALGCAAAAVVAACRREARPWLAVAALTVAIWLPLGNMPGVRRAVALSVVAALVAAVAVDVLARTLPARRHLVNLVAVALVCLPLAVSLLCWQAGFHSGASRLTPDFPLAAPMPAAMEAYDADLRSGRLTVEQAVATRDGARVLAAVWLLADRTGHGTAGLPDPEQIVRASLPR